MNALTMSALTMNAQTMIIGAPAGPGPVHWV